MLIKTAESYSIDSYEPNNIEPNKNEFRYVLGGELGIVKSALFVTSSFTELPGYSGCCPEFTIAEGNSTSFVFNTNYYISRYFRINAGFGLHFGNFTFSESKEEFISVNGELYNGRFAHIVNINQASYSLNFDIDFRTYKELWFNFGLIYFHPYESLFEQYEQIVEPNDRGVFVDTGTRRRNQLTGDITDFTDGSFLINLGLFYKMPLNDFGSLFLVPRLAGTYAISSMYADLDWKYNTIDISIGLEFNFNEPQVIDSENVQKKIPNDAILLSAVPIANGQEVIELNPQLKITNMHYILVQPASATSNDMIEDIKLNKFSNYKLDDVDGSFLLLGTESMVSTNFDALKIFFLKQNDFEFDNWKLNIKNTEESRIIKEGTDFDLREMVIPIDKLKEFQEFNNLSIELTFINSGEIAFSTEHKISLSSIVETIEIFNFDIYNIEKLKLLDDKKYYKNVDVFIANKILTPKIKSTITNILSSKGMNVEFNTENYSDMPLDPDSISIIVKLTVK